MKYLLTLLLICGTMLCVNAKNYKINRNEQIRPFELKIEKIHIHGNDALIFVKIKQIQRYSYNVSFADIYLVTPGNPDGVKGKLESWNDDTKIYRDEKTVSDEEWEEFTLAFPAAGILEAPSFTLKIGNVLDRNKTELIVPDIVIKNKK